MSAESTVAIGSDHGGYELKQKVVGWVQELGLTVSDQGTHSTESCDYPLLGYAVAREVAAGKAAWGILVCKTGIGMAMVANKLPGVRAGVCKDAFDAERSREHNNANVLVLGSEKLGAEHAQQIIRTWFKTHFDETSRHARRVAQITAIEAAVMKGAVPDFETLRREV